MLLPILVACVAIFIYLTGQWLPPLVAAHFDASGAANGYLPRSTYLGFTLALAAGAPLLILLGSRATLSNPATRINVPYGDYWLQPPRRPATVDFLQGWIARFGAMLAILVCFVHWLVVRANGAQPAHLSGTPFYGALIAFLVGIVIWLKGFFDRFRSPQ